MNSFREIAESEEQLPVVAKKLLAFAEDKKVFLFKGEMGAGKTTFIKELCKLVGVNEGLSSPTYSVINEYLSTDGKRVCHFDLYRLKTLAECTDIGMEDYLYSGDYCFIEWPEVAEELYPEDVVRISIYTEGNSRIIKAES